MLGQYFDILVLLVVVVLIFNRLKAVLGTRPESTQKQAEENAAKLFDLIVKEAQQNQQSMAAQVVSIDNNVLEEEKTETLSDTDKVLNSIPNFDKNNFLSGAKRAFEIIVEAFAKGDIATLEKLVNKNLLKKFQEVIENRHAQGVTAEADFIGFNKAEIIKAKIGKNQVVKIIVEFVSEQVNLLKNNQGEVIEGDDKFIQNITDVWTFERALTYSNPNWILVSTKK